MEVHHHSQSPRRKWTHYFWEFFMLFLAVTLGFLVENEREHMIEGKRAKAYARMLKADLIKDTIELNSFISMKDSIQSNFKRFSSIMEKKHDEVTFEDLNFLLNNKVDILKIFTPNDVTYSQLKNSGSLRYFTNMKLIGMLGLYDAEIKRLQTDWNNTKDYFGGIRSSYLLEFYLSAEKFLTNYKLNQKNVLVQVAGYSFKSFDEGGAILNFFMWFQDGVIDSSYQKLKKIANDIIALLDNQYHLD